MRNLRYKGLLGAIAIVIAALSFGWFFAPSRGSAAVRPTLNDVAQGLVCQCGCGLTVANCNEPHCEFAIPARKKIQEMIDHGMTKAEILAFFRNKYGEAILSAPSMHGFDLLAWLMPFFAVGAGGVFVGVAAYHWRSRRGTERARETAGPASRAPTARANFDPELKRRLEDELKEQR